MTSAIEQLPDEQLAIDELFREESLDHLGRMASALAGIGDGPPEHSLLQSMFRSMHSLKGTAAALGLSAVTELVHGVESLLEGLLARRLQWSYELASVMTQVCWTLEAMINHRGDPVAADVHQSLLASLAFFDAEELDKSAVPEPSLQWEILLGPLDADDDAVAAREMFKDLPELGLVQQENSPGPGCLRWVLTSSCTQAALVQVLSLHVAAGKLVVQAMPADAQPPALWSAQASEPLGAASSIKVSIAHLQKMDMQLQLACEAQAHLSLLLQQVGGLNQPDIRTSVQAVTQAIGDLRQTLAASRRVRAAEVLKRFPLLVENLAKQLGKDIVLHVKGSELELDRFVMAHISEALVHLLRNSCDHGIEPPERRVVSGKPARGTVTLSLRSSDSSLQVEVQDDGAGLSREAILGRAHQLGMLLPDPATDEAVWALVLAPGFSTAPAVTALSGRGVGLDVVRCAVEALGGQLSIRSAPGQGTAFMLDLPLPAS
jgi:two-component system chemotaxis sensor kinase CheA